MKEALFVVVLALVAVGVKVYFTRRPVPSLPIAEAPVGTVDFRAQVRNIRRVRDLAVGETAKVSPWVDKDGRFFLELTDRINEEYMVDFLVRAGQQTYVLTLYDKRWDDPVDPAPAWETAIYPKTTRMK